MINTFSGKEQFIQFYNQLEKELKSGDYYYTFAFQNEYQSEEAKNLLTDFHQNLAKKKIDDRAIFNKKIEDVVRETYRANNNLQMKFKDLQLPVGMVVTKDKLLQIGWRPEPFIIEIQNKPLLKYYYDFFLESWNSNQSIEFAIEGLEKLGVEFKEDALVEINNLKDYPEALSVTEEIEKIEKDWAFEHKAQDREFGQKVKGETIKLWSVPRTTAELLEYLVIANKSQNVLEIGTSAGYSTLYLAMGANYNDGRVTTIEKLEPKATLAESNFKKSKLKNITLIKDDALNLLESEKIKDIDFIFLDADKENYGKYFDLFMPYLKKGGLIVADNIFDYGHMMQDYLNKVLGTKLPGSQSDPRVISYSLPLDNGILITLKIKD